MTVQEIRELIGKKTEEINGYLESRDADKAEAALEEKRRLQRLLAVREAEDEEEKEELRGQKRKKEEKRTVSAVSELRAAVKFALKGKEALTDEERAAVTIDNNAAILPEQFVNDIQVLREGFPSLKEHCHNVRATSNQGKMPFAKIGGKKLTKYKSGTKLTGEAANTQDISYNIENYGALVPIANDLQEDEAVNIIQDVIKPDFAEAGVNSENDEILKIVEDNATDKSTGVTDWRGVKKVIDGVLPTLRAKTVVITNLTGYVYLQSQEDKNGRNLDLVKTVNGKDYFQNRQLITLSDEAEGVLSATLQENLTGVRVVRAFGQQKDEIEKFDRCSRDFRDKTFHLSKMLAVYWGGSDAMGYLQIAISLMAGIIMAVKGEITLGNMLIFTTYTGMLTWPVRQLGRILADLGKASVSLGRIDEILSAPAEEEPGSALKSEIHGKVEFKHVCFGYDRFDDVLSDISFTANPGETIAILGNQFIKIRYTSCLSTFKVGLFKPFAPDQSDRFLSDSSLPAFVSLNGSGQKRAVILQKFLITEFIQNMLVKKHVVLFEQFFTELGYF